MGRPQDLWLFGYGSLIWRPEFGFVERRPARVHGWHRALKMWSRVNRGTVENPGLVFGLLSGGSCRGMVFRVPAADGLETLGRLWLREMPTGVYDPRWLTCETPRGTVRALAFTLSRRSPNFTGELGDDALPRSIFASAVGRYGSSLDYAQPDPAGTAAPRASTTPRWRGWSGWQRPQVSAQADCGESPASVYPGPPFQFINNQGVTMPRRLVAPALAVAAASLLAACGSHGVQGRQPAPAWRRPPRSRRTRPSAT